MATAEKSRTKASGPSDEAKAGSRAAGSKKAGSGGRAAKPKGRRARVEAKQKARAAKLRARAGSRWRVHYDVDGPRVRLGMAWFVGAVVAFTVGIVGIVLYFGVAFGAAGSHCLRTWRAAGRDVDPTVALGSVAVVVTLAAFGPKLMGLGVLALAGFAVAVSIVGGDDESPGVSMGNVGLILQCALPAAVAGGCVVLLADREIWSAIALVLLVSAYESGDYLVGSGAANNVEGPLAGAAGVLVVSMAVAAGGFPPFGVGEAMLFGLLVAPLAFGGQYLATAMLPHSRAFAPALRRVDSLLLAAPIWYFGIDAFVS